MSQRFDGVREANRGLGLLTPFILQKSRMRRRARTDLCGGRSVMVVPTATANCRNQGVSDNVGTVNPYLSVLLRALRRARHFALVEDVALPYQPRPARNQFQVRNSVRPMHLFGHTFDHDY